jgi:RimJ/RimL family protein N-acetyltransferase
MAVDLLVPLQDGPVSLVPFSDMDIEPLRYACNQDPDIWEIYPISLYDDNFDSGMAYFKSCHETSVYKGFAANKDNALVGITHFINADPINRIVEIGGTYLAPSVRGTGYNAVMKRLMIDHAFACGYRKIEFRVDARNARSQAAVLKLGALHEGTLRKNRVTWTGFVRDTMVFGLFQDEWQGRQI